MVRNTYTRLEANNITTQPQLVNELLASQYPQARCELEFRNPFELLVATVLSAQSTDFRVNRVSVELFRRWPDATALAAADVDEVAAVIRPVGMFRTKSERIISLAAKLVADYGGEVPDDAQSLVQLPGVGRKTANVVLAEAYGIPGITADTHLIRLAGRLGWTNSTNPDRVADDVEGLFAPEDWNQLCHRVIWHGRRRCHARRPACGVCVVQELCPAAGTGPLDPDTAESLVREPRR